MAKVNDLIEKLVDENEILADRLLGDDLEVRLESLNNPVEQLECKGRVHVMPCDSDDEEVTLHDVAESRTAHSPDRSANLLVVQNVIFERGCDNTTVMITSDRVQHTKKKWERTQQ